ncbi:SCO6745 family protein [Amycolatopsis sp. lyj-109]|uniref:SCO6745 family protein n=1 Tax=Amycolatopsis sp. lyj-109 TaxID=2789287 RepID=UPI00397D838E
MTSPRAGRRCHNYLNALHSTIYFSPELGKDLADLGIGDPMAAYFLGRAAPLGPVGPGVVTATFYGFAHELIAQHVPHAWSLAPPEVVLAARLRAVDATMRSFLSEETLGSPELAEAAELALRATEGCVRPAHPLYAAHADLVVPDSPHLALWHAATLLREHRGDTHFAVLVNAELDGLESLVSHSASSDGMAKEMVMTKRGWTQEDWTAAEDRLRRRRLLTAEGALTGAGLSLRRHLEKETDRLDRHPYEHLGAAGVRRLTELGAGFTKAAAEAGAFPAPLAEFFTRG